MGSLARRRLLLLLACAVLAVSPLAAAQTSCANCTFSGGRLYAACSALEELGASVHWTYHAANGTADVAFRVPQAASGWAAWAINPSAVGMLGANAVVAYHDPGTGVVAVVTAVIDSYAPVVEDGNLSLAVYRRGAEYADGAYAIYATIALPGNSTRQNIVWQAGTTSGNRKGLPDGHQTYGDNVMSSRSWDFSTSEAAVVNVPTPSDGGSNNVYSAMLRRKNVRSSHQHAS